ncbi:MAG: hypothetical protein ACFFAN_08340 [Promethearchaeota archaeon]
MQEKPTPEELAKGALELLEKAELFEERRNWDKALHCYKDAAERLKESGYLAHRIDDIYTRIAEINNYIKQEKIFQQAQFIPQQTQIKQDQAESFIFLDNAKKFEEEGNFMSAITQYMAAIRLFVKSGWTESQLENLKSKVTSLAQNLEYQQEAQNRIHRKSQGVSFTPQSTLEKKANSLKTYETKKQKDEITQNRAFNLIDRAKKFEKDKIFDKAILNYEEAIELLNSIGWNQQTLNLSVIVNKLKKDKEDFEKIQLKEKKETPFSLEELREKKPTISQSRIELRRLKIIEFEEKKKKEEKIQSKAFKLIEMAKKLEKEKKYDNAINQFKQAIECFKSLSWNAYIQPLYNNIKDIKEKLKKEEFAEKIKMKRQKNLNKLQKAILEKQEGQYIQSDEDLESQRMRSKRKRLEKEQLEKEFLTILNKGDKVLQAGEYDKAINQYKNALKLLESLGAGWESYISKIKETILSIKEKKQYFAKSESELQKIKQEKKQDESDFRKLMAEQLSKDREKLKKRKFDLHVREDDFKIRERQKSKGLKFLDAAQEYLEERDYDKAIYAYQNARNLFAEIQWTEELPTIEKMIKKIESKKNELKISKHQQMKDRIKVHKKENLFQEQLLKQLHLEKEKLSQKAINIRRKEGDLDSLKRIKNEIDNLLEESEILIKRALYDKVLEHYRSVELKLKEINFPTEGIRYIIKDIEEQKKEREILKQKEFELDLQKKEEEEEFHHKITENLEKEKEHLKTKKIETKKLELMRAFSEKRKEELFKILDEAENFINSSDYDQALESYRKAEVLSHELNFPTESIKSMITKIINLKKKKELAEELEIQRELEKLEQEKELQTIIDDRQKQEREKKKAQQLAFQERERMIQEQKNYRNAAFSLLDEAGLYLKKEIPDYETAISLYVQARDILQENIGWAPEINNLNDLIKDLQQEKTNLIEKRKLEMQAELRRQQEYELFQEELKKRKSEAKIQKEIRERELKKFEQKKELAEKLKQEGLNLIDEGKKSVDYREFDKAYDYFNKAITHFKEIGWGDHIHIIESEINKTRLLEEKVKKEELEVQRIQEELDQQRKLEKQRRSKEDQKIKQVIGDVSDFTDDVAVLIETKKKELKLTEEQKSKKIKNDAKIFSKDLGKLIQLRQEIRIELAKKEELIKKEKEKAQDARKREEVDDIARMIKDVAKKKKS